jgi:hypothetical protein
MNIELNKRVTLTTTHSASSYRIPVLVIDGVAYGWADNFKPALIEILKSGDEFDRLHQMHTGEQLLTQLALKKGGYESPEIKAVRAFYASRA